MFDGKIPETLIEKLDLNTNLLKKNLDANKWYRVFGRGIISGLGATVGLAIVISALLYVLNLLHVVPFMDGYVDQTKNLLQNAR